MFLSPKQRVSVDPSLKSLPKQSSFPLWSSKTIQQAFSYQLFPALRRECAVAWCMAPEAENCLLQQCKWLLPWGHPQDEERNLPSKGSTRMLSSLGTGAKAGKWQRASKDPKDIRHCWARASTRMTKSCSLVSPNSHGTVSSYMRDRSEFGGNVGFWKSTLWTSWIRKARLLQGLLQEV